MVSFRDQSGRSCRRKSTRQTTKEEARRETNENGKDEHEDPQKYKPVRNPTSIAQAQSLISSQEGRYSIQRTTWRQLTRSHSQIGFRTYQPLEQRRESVFASGRRRTEDLVGHRNTQYSIRRLQSEIESKATILRANSKKKPSTRAYWTSEPLLNKYKPFLAYQVGTHPQELRVS